MRRGLLALILLLGAGLARAEEPPHEIVLAATETPFRQYSENGQPAGYVVDVLQEAFSRTGHPVKIRFMPWARCLAEAKAGTIDGVFGANRTPDRETDLLFSPEPLMDETQSAFTRAEDQAQYSPTIAGLADVRIGIINGSSIGAEFDRAIAEKKLHHIEVASNFDSLLHMLAGRHVDVIIADSLSIRGMAKRDGTLRRLKELPTPLLKGPIFVAFSRAHDLKDISRDFSISLREMKKDGRYDAIFSKYFD